MRAAVRRIVWCGLGLACLVGCASDSGGGSSPAGSEDEASADVTGSPAGGDGGAGAGTGADSPDEGGEGTGASPGSPEQPPPGGPVTGLRLNQIQLYGTHNSYHVEGTTALAVPDWAYTHAPLGQQLDEQGVRKFELDLHFVDGDVQVKHVPVLDEGSHCPLLRDCLEQVKSWSDGNPGHHTVFIQIEPKDDLTSVSDYDTFFAEIEEDILRHWPRERIVTPDDVQGSHATLRDAVLSGEGWPTVEESRGKLLFFVNHSGEFRDRYSAGMTSLAGRLMFVESGAEEDVAAFRIMNTPDPEAIGEAVRAGFMVRTRADGVPLPDDADDRAVRARDSGAQVISTDYPVPHDSGYVFELPGGAPSRCNPINAPEGCAVDWVEALP